MNIEKIQREVRFAKLRFPRENGPLSRKGLAMLVEMAANDLVALAEPVDTLSLRTQVIDFVNEGVRRRHYERPAAVDVDEVLAFDRLKDRAELENFRIAAEGGQWVPPYERSVSASLLP